MIILSNCLTDRADEGTRKVVRSLTTRLKERSSAVKVVTYGNAQRHGDRHFDGNQLLLDPALHRYLRQTDEPVLYMPSPARSTMLALRLLILSRSVRRGLTVLLTMPFPLDPVSRFLIKRSGARILTLSASACEYYRTQLDESVLQLKAGVDLRQFQPADLQEKKRLREKYAIPGDQPVVLHVGHLKQGRNISQFLKLDSRFHGVLVVSTQTENEQDEQLRRQITAKENLTLIDTYLPHIEELYRLADVYLFPVEDPESCISLPLSVMEAAACGVCVVTTPFGQLRELIQCEGFYQIEDFSPRNLNALLQRAAEEGKDPRPAVMEYDWSHAANMLFELCGESE